MAMAQRKQGGSLTGISGSLRHANLILTESITSAAFSVGTQESVRSIGGRLGGHFDSSRNFGLHLLFEEGDEAIIDEESRLKRDDEAAAAPSSPPLIVWIFPALLCALAYALYNVFIKRGSASIHPILGGVILQFVAAIMGSMILGMLKLKVNAKLEYDRSGIQWAMCAGLAVGIAEMLSFCVSGMGVPVTHSIPIIIGGSVMFGAVLGVLILGEGMMSQGWSGVGLLITGVALVATDPGPKVVEAVGDSFESAPTLVVWIFPALVCASAYAFYNIFIKLGSASINPILGGVILQYVAALFGSLLLGGILLKGGTELKCERAGVLEAVYAGLAVGSAEMLSFCVSGMGVQATQSIPIIIGGSVMFGAVLGLIMLGESMMLQGWLGVLLLMSGISLVATDPGEKVAGH